MKLTQTTVTQILDKESGELVTVENSKTFSKKACEDTFYMTFVDFIAPLYKVRSENARKLLTWMCEHAEFNTGIVLLTTANRKQLTEDIGISSNTITNNLAILKKANLISGEKGNFQINPQIFWKGDLKTRKQLLKDSNFHIKFELTNESAV